MITDPWVSTSPQNLGFSIESLHKLGSTIAHQPHRILDLGQGEVLSPQLSKLRKAFAPSVKKKRVPSHGIENEEPLVNKHGTWKIMGKWHEMFNMFNPSEYTDVPMPWSISRHFDFQPPWPQIRQQQWTCIRPSWHDEGVSEDGVPQFMSF